MDVDYSPTGREFVAGSYDRSLRIFATSGGHSREVGRGAGLERAPGSSLLQAACTPRL